MTSTGQDGTQPKTDVPPPELPSTPSWADTRSAVKEEKEWSTLDKVREKNDVNWLSVYGWVVIAITITFTTIFLASLVAWALHYILPPKWIWLTDAQLSKIQSILFSGGMGAIISSIIKRQLDKFGGANKSQ